MGDASYHEARQIDGLEDYDFARPNAGTSSPGRRRPVYYDGCIDARCHAWQCRSTARLPHFVDRE